MAEEKKEKEEVWKVVEVATETGLVLQKNGENINQLQALAEFGNILEELKKNLVG